MSKIKCFNCGEYGHFACDCLKACNNANIARESEQKGKSESMLDLDSTSVSDTIPTKNGRELMEKWVSELKDKFLGPNWQRMLSCAYTTQLLHSTAEVCWNNRDSYFIWFEFVC